MLSSTYQQQSEPRPAERWRATPRTGCCGGSTASGSISRRCATRCWPSRARSVRLWAARRRRSTPAFSTRRTVYGFIDRQNLDGVYRTFDFAVPDATSPRRFVTTVPQQALFLMNSPFLHEQARRLAALVARSPVEAPGRHGRLGRGPAEQVRRLYRRVLGRLPEPDELALALAFIRRDKPAQAGPPLETWRLGGPEHRAAALALGTVEPGVAADQRIYVCGLIEITRRAALGP